MSYRKCIKIPLPVPWTALIPGISRLSWCDFATSHTEPSTTCRKYTLHYFGKYSRWKNLRSQRRLAKLEAVNLSKTVENEQNRFFQYEEVFSFACMKCFRNRSPSTLVISHALRAVPPRHFIWSTAIFMKSAVASAIDFVTVTASTISSTASTATKTTERQLHAFSAQTSRIMITNFRVRVERMKRVCKSWLTSWKSAEFWDENLMGVRVSGRTALKYRLSACQGASWACTKLRGSGNVLQGCEVLREVSRWWGADWPVLGYMIVPSSMIRYKLLKCEWKVYRMSKFDLIDMGV